VTDESLLEVDNDGLAGQIEYFQAKALRQAITEYVEARGIPAPDVPLGNLTDHELRWAIRDGIAQMYEHLGLGDPHERTPGPLQIEMEEE
jgi:hypothetical protein